MTLQESLDAIKKRGPRIPPEVQDVIQASVRSLVASGAAERALQVGDRVPSFRLPDSQDTLVASEDLLRQGPLIICFFRGSWCPYCVLELQALQTALPQVEAAGAHLIALSPQQSKYNLALAQKHSLTFPLLSDIGNRVAQRFELTWNLPHDLQKVYLTLGTDLPRYNGDTSWELPMPARYVVGKDGAILYRTVSPDYTQRPELALTIGALPS